MSIRKFIIQICGIFLSMSLSKTIEKVISMFSPFTLLAGLLIFFLSLNFFFAKFKQLQEGDETISFLGFVVNIVTLSCFAAMPFFIDNFIGLMCTQIVLRVSDILLIGYNNKWRVKNIDKLEGRWLAFDISYLFAIIGFIFMFLYIDFVHMPLVLIAIYLAMGVFESLFDFFVNGKLYGLTAPKNPQAPEAQSGQEATIKTEEAELPTQEKSE